MNDLTTFLLATLLVGIIVASSIGTRAFLNRPEPVLKPISFIDVGVCKTVYYPEKKLVKKLNWIQSWYVDSWLGECEL